MTGSNDPEISVVVANWNGGAFLREGLASLLRSAAASGRACELIVVDDCSTDGSVALIRERFPEIRLFCNSVNLRFAHTSNRGASEARGRVLVMVNNDVEAPEDFLRVLTAPFFEENPIESDIVGTPLFAVGAKTVDRATGAPNQLCMRAVWRWRGIEKAWSDPGDRTETTYIQGGAAAYDRSRFLELGGFNPLYSPGYWEDYDLSYRAAKAGWRVLYEPRAVAWHVGKGSLGPILGPHGLPQIDERNRLWFNWVNLDSAAMLARQVLALPAAYGLDLLRGRGLDGPFGFLRACLGLSRALQARRARLQGDPPVARTDQDLLGIS